MPPRAPSTFTYFAPRDVLIPRVARQCIMRFCEAVANAGADVELVTLNVRLEYDEPTRNRSLWDVYGVEPRFRVRTLPTLLRQDSPDRAVTLQRFASYTGYSLWQALTSRRLRSGPATFYFRNQRTALPLSLARRLLGGRARLLLEVHTPVDARHGRLVRRLDGVVCISRALAEDLTERLGVDPARVLVAHTGVDLERVDFARAPRPILRRRLDLPEGPLVVYTGKVHRRSREIDLLLETARRLPEDVSVLIVGGREDEVASLRARVRTQGPANVRFAGFVAPAEVHAYQLAADALVMYYPKEIEFNDYRSPAKLFEYLASGNPVVAADYRSTREIVTPDVGVLVPPERPDLLAAELAGVLADPARAAALGEAGRARAAEHTWDGRARRILDFIERLPPR